MSESNLTPFTIKSIMRPKTASLSKLDSKHLIQKSKPDYFHILNQIKEKTKKFNMDDSTLFNKYWHNNTQKVGNSKYKYKLNRNNIPKSLITEALYNMKQISYKNFPATERLFNKNKLILKQNHDSPKKLINEIIKFEDSKK
jgi:SOS response regulatory protein OraA/RecX